MNELVHAETWSENRRTLVDTFRMHICNSCLIHIEPSYSPHHQVSNPTAMTPPLHNPLNSLTEKAGCTA